MERLTRIDGISQNEMIKCFNCNLEKAGADLEHCGYCDHWQTVLDRLAAYEDKIPFDRLDEAAALVKARDEGLLIEMPCKPGTELFGHCHIRGANPISRSYFYPPYVPKLGVDAWLTRAEAEAALGGGGDGA